MFSLTRAMLPVRLDGIRRVDARRTVRPGTLAAARRAAAVREIYLTGLDLDAGIVPGDEA